MPSVYSKCHVTYICVDIFFMQTSLGLQEKFPVGIKWFWIVCILSLYAVALQFGFIGSEGSKTTPVW